MESSDVSFSLYRRKTFYDSKLWIVSGERYVTAYYLIVDVNLHENDSLLLLFHIVLKLIIIMKIKMKLVI